MQRSEIDAKLAQCEQWAKWRPLQPQSLLTVALNDEGFVGKIFVNAYGRRQYQALVLATNECRWVKPADLVVFDVGKGEHLQTQHGEVFYWLNEWQCDGSEPFFPPTLEPTQTASGLWVPA